MKDELSVKDVQKILRKEVGFGCPVHRCGNPYLEYHHFDPPQHIRKHNDPSGMVALCAAHHSKADGGIYTDEQLRAFKNDTHNSERVKADLDWMRQDLLAIVGSVACYETPIVLLVDGISVISFRRTEEGFLTLNVNFPSLVAETRISIRDSFIEFIGEVQDFRCTPHGKELEVKYQNGDYLRLRFNPLMTLEQVKKKFPWFELPSIPVMPSRREDYSELLKINFPLTVLEINLKISGTEIDISPVGVSLGGGSIKSGLSFRDSVGWTVNTSNDWKYDPRL